MARQVAAISSCAGVWGAHVAVPREVDDPALGRTVRSCKVRPHHPKARGGVDQHPSARHEVRERVLGRVNCARWHRSPPTSHAAAGRAGTAGRPVPLTHATQVDAHHPCEILIGYLMRPATTAADTSVGVHAAQRQLSCQFSTASGALQPAQPNATYTSIAP
eukprot:COSAG01_NODE_4257_length_5203_cov_10.296630_10_plen_162_part_00